MKWYQISAICIISFIVLVLLSIVFYKSFFKRFYDIVFSTLALIILSPLLLILTVIGTIAMGGNPFFVQSRPGKISPKTGKEKIFNLIKFRSMMNKKDASGKLLPDEKRLTEYGKFLRKSSLDELPELVCILTGDMSFVGPRPWCVEYLSYYTDEERHRHDVSPGLTGYAQVNGRTKATWEDRITCDLFYVGNLSLKLDVEIIVKTFICVFKKSDIIVTAEEQGNFDDYRIAQKNAKNTKQF